MIVEEPEKKEELMSLLINKKGEDKMECRWLVRMLAENEEHKNQNALRSSKWREKKHDEITDL